MFKQVQEMHRQQKFLSFTDSRQHSGILKNVDGVQYSLVVNGTPVHSSSNMFTNWGQQQHSGAPSFQGMSQLASAQDHHSTDGDDGVQHYDGSSYDSPKPSSANGTHSFSGGQHLDSLNQTSLCQDYLKNNLYGQVHQKTDEDSTSGSFKHACKIDESEQSGWPSNQLDNDSMHISPSQGSATLDPLEEKILFSMDDNLWDISSRNCTEASAGNNGSSLGSWSALMQSALGETSSTSSETKLQEEQSCLTFQNTDPSADNHTSNFVESGHRQSECASNSTQPALSLSVTKYQYLKSPGMTFPRFYRAVTSNQSEEDNHEHCQVFSQIGGRFDIDHDHQQSSQTVGKPQPQTMTQTKCGWVSPGYGPVESNPSQLQFTSADQQINNNDFWSKQKDHSGTSSSIVHNNVWMNNFPSGPNFQTSLLASPLKNSPESTNANHYAQQYTTLGVRSISQPSVASNLSQQDSVSSKAISQRTNVPVQKHFVGTKSDIVQASGSSEKQFGDMIGYPQNLSEQEIENVMPSGSSAKPVIKHEEDKSQRHILSEVQPDSVIQPITEMQELVEKQGRRLEKISSMNQMNILYSNQDDTVSSTNAVDTTRPNKRKSRTYELLPWHKELAKNSIPFPNTRMRELDWAQETSQLTEVASESELLKFSHAIIRPRKRLILTTKLMQTLLRPAPKAILSMNSASAYESVAYIVARLSLGVACNISSAPAKTDHDNISDKEGKSNLEKVLENFSKRIKGLENVLQRFEEISSIVDISVEYMDLERFSIINRFAKYHSRPQPSPPGPTKMHPQRYMSAVPMPKEIPNSLPCLSL